MTAISLEEAIERDRRAVLETLKAIVANVDSGKLLVRWANGSPANFDAAREVLALAKKHSDWLAGNFNKENT